MLNNSSIALRLPDAIKNQFDIEEELGAGKLVNQNNLFFDRTGKIFKI